MSWFADWTIRYNGNDRDRFIKLAKLFIPDYENRFRESDEKDIIDCIKDINWGSADRDISKIIEYLGEHDTLDVVIYGESGPYLKDKDGNYILDKDGEYQTLECEKQTFRKQNGEVIIDNTHPNEDRTSYDELGLYYGIEDLNEYIEFITREIGPDDEIMPIAQSILFDVLSRYDESNKEAMELRDKFSTIETTREYFDEMYKKQREVREKKRKERQGLPYFLVNLPDSAIAELGGIDNLKKLIEVFGEEASKALLRCIDPYMIKKRIKDREIKPGELISMLTTVKSRLQGREIELSTLEQEAGTIAETEELIYRQIGKGAK